jgi:hypothetical protein
MADAAELIHTMYSIQGVRAGGLGCGMVVYNQGVRPEFMELWSFIEVRIWATDVFRDEAMKMRDLTPHFHRFKRLVREKLTHLRARRRLTREAVHLLLQRERGQGPRLDSVLEDFHQEESRRLGADSSLLVPLDAPL